MISIEDLVELSGLSLDEIEALAEFNHEPLSLSAAHGEYLLDCQNGVCTIKHCFKENLSHAIKKGDKVRVKELLKIYKTFHNTHH